MNWMCPRRFPMSLLLTPSKGSLLPRPLWWVNTLSQSPIASTVHSTQYKEQRKPWTVINTVEKLKKTTTTNTEYTLHSTQCTVHGQKYTVHTTHFEFVLTLTELFVPGGSPFLSCCLPPASPCPLPSTLTRGCLKVHGWVPLVLCLFVDPL